MGDIRNPFRQKKVEVAVGNVIVQNLEIVSRTTAIVVPPIPAPLVDPLRRGLVFPKGALDLIGKFLGVALEYLNLLSFGDEACILNEYGASGGSNQDEQNGNTPRPSVGFLYFRHGIIGIMGATAGWNVNLYGHIANSYVQWYIVLCYEIALQ
jgi:hypothetical protein